MTDETPRATRRLNIHRAEYPDTIELQLVGEVDIETAALIDEHLAQLDGAEPSHLLIDLGAVTFMDSTGLASILRAHRSAENNGHTLAFRPGSPQVQRLFKLTGIDERLTFDTRPRSANPT